MVQFNFTAAAATATVPVADVMSDGTYFYRCVDQAGSKAQKGRRAVVAKA